MGIRSSSKSGQVADSFSFSGTVATYNKPGIQFGSGLVNFFFRRPNNFLYILLLLVTNFLPVNNEFNPSILPDKSDTIAMVVVKLHTDIAIFGELFNELRY